MNTDKTFGFYPCSSVFICGFILSCSELARKRALAVGDLPHLPQIYLVEHASIVEVALLRFLQPPKTSSMVKSCTLAKRLAYLAATSGERGR